MMAHFKMYTIAQEQYLSSNTVLWASSLHIHLVQFYTMSKKSNKHVAG